MITFSFPTDGTIDRVKKFFSDAPVDFYLLTPLLVFAENLFSELPVEEKIIPDVNTSTLTNEEFTVTVVPKRFYVAKDNHSRKDILWWLIDIDSNGLIVPYDKQSKIIALTDNFVYSQRLKEYLNFKEDILDTTISSPHEMSLTFNGIFAKKYVEE
jgi:hypothetical protein